MRYTIIYFFGAFFTASASHVNPVSTPSPERALQCQICHGRLVMESKRRLLAHSWGGSDIGKSFLFAKKRMGMPRGISRCSNCMGRFSEGSGSSSVSGSVSGSVSSILSFFTTSFRSYYYEEDDDCLP